MAEKDHDMDDASGSVLPVVGATIVCDLRRLTPGGVR
jgi:hypothetical protein